jgi:1-deoxy-D-xylulose-5-phosphate synthase
MFLEWIDSPKDIKELNIAELSILSEEIRRLIIEVVSKTGGHLSSSLGVVELTLALHYVFDTPEDKVIFDVGHQCYAHKIITGRRARFNTLRQDSRHRGFPEQGREYL